MNSPCRFPLKAKAMSFPHPVYFFMRDNFTQLYIHFTWSTWDRLPLITPDIQLEQQDSPTIPLRLVAGGMRVRE